MLPAIVLDLSALEPVLTLPAPELFYRLLITVGWMPLLWVLAWGAFEIYLEEKAGHFLSHKKRITLAIRVPRSSEQAPKAVENIFAMVKGTKSVITKKEKWKFGKFLIPTSFDIVCAEGQTQFCINTEAGYRDLWEASVYAQYPDAEITLIEDYTKGVPDEFPNGKYEVFGGEITLDQPAYFPIRTYKDFEHLLSKENRLKDPLTTLLEAFARFKPGEQFWVQILVHPDDKGGGAVKQGIEYIKKTFGKESHAAHHGGLVSKMAEPVAWIPKEILSQFGVGAADAHGAPEKKQAMFFNMTQTEKVQLDGVQQKIGQPGFGVKIRWAYVAEPDKLNKGGRNSLWKGYIAQYSHTSLNGFRYDPDTMPRDDYFWLLWEYKRKQRMLVKAMKNRSWSTGSSPMYLSVEELATLWHFPSIDVKAPLIRKTDSRQGEAPLRLPIADVDGDGLPDGPLVELDADGNPIGVRLDAPGEEHIVAIPTSADLIEPMPPEPPALPDVLGGEKPADAHSKDFVPPNLPL
jgi:hypothetical protein